MTQLQHHGKRSPRVEYFIVGMSAGAVLFGSLIGALSVGLLNMALAMHRDARGLCLG